MLIRNSHIVESKIAGNLFDKYGSRNPIIRRIMAEFDRGISDLVTMASPTEIHDVGCGEGTWVIRWRNQGIDARGSDASATIISDEASPFCRQRSIEELNPKDDSADLITCLEVLEHVDKPQVALQRLRAITRRHIILSVPHEPLWRVLNMARGAWVTELGNTPGHVNHWLRGAFIELVSEYFEVIAVRTPLPWTMLLAKSKRV